MTALNIEATSTGHEGQSNKRGPSVGSAAGWRELILRGGRVTKYKGIAGGVSPLSAGLGSAALALGMISSFAVGGLMLSTPATYAGECTALPASVCTGPADAAGDTTQTFTGNDISIVTDPGFGLDVGAGNAISINGSDGVVFNDTNASAITGNNYGIEATNSGSGDLVITSNGHVTGTDWDAISVENNAGTGNIIISTNDLDAGRRGIEARLNGTGGIQITSTGTINSGWDGVLAEAGAASTGGVTIKVNEINAGDNTAIDATNKGASGETSVTATGTLTSANGHGIRINGVDGANAGALAGSLTIDAQDIVTGSRSTSSDIFTSGGLDGIQLTGTIGAAGAPETTNITTGNIDAAQNGVNLAREINRVSGETNVTTGNITAGGIGVVIDSADNTDNYALNVKTGNVISGSTGIAVNQSGTGSISVETGDISAGMATAAAVNGFQNGGGYGVRLDSDPHGATVAGAGGADWNLTVGNITVTNRSTGAFAGTGIGLGTIQNGGNGNTTVTSGNIQAGTGVIYNRNSTGTVSISTGDITATTGNGIQFGTNLVKNDLIINTGDITAAGKGIVGDTLGNAAIDSLATINVGSITSGSHGIDVIHSGTGAVTINSTGTIKSDGIGVNLLNDSLTLTPTATDGQTIITVNNIDTPNNTAINVDSNAVKGTTITTNGAINTLAAGDIAGDGMRVIEREGPLVINVAQSSTITSFNNTMELTNHGTAGTTINVDGTLRSTAQIGAADGVIWIWGTPGTTEVNINDGSAVQAADKTSFAVTDNGGDTVVKVGNASVTGGFRLGGGDDALTFNGTDMANVGTLNGGAGSTGGDVLTLNAVQNFTRKLQTAGQEIQNWDAVNLNGGTADLVGTLTTGVFTLGKDNAGNPAILSIGADDVGDTLTVTGNYVGAGGAIVVDTVLGDDSSATDLIKIGGSTSGSTSVMVNNIGGAGAPTVEGIKVIDVGGASNGTFALIGDYEINGQQAVIAGAYGYTLWQNGVNNPTDGDWYLRSQLKPVDPVDPTGPTNPTGPSIPTGPIYQPGVPVYEAYSQVLLGMNGLPTLQQRVGNRYWTEGQAAADAAGTPAIDENGVWGIVEASHAKFRPDDTTSGAEYDLDIWRLRAGVDGLILQTDDGKLIAGLTGHYGQGSSSISSVFGPGSISIDAYGVGATATWYANSGFYLDGQAQVSWFNSDLSSDWVGGLTSDNGGFGYALSIEAGQRVDISENWAIVPQAQLVYSNVRFDGFTDPFGAQVGGGSADTLVGRFGLAVEYNNSWTNEAGQNERAAVYGIANLHYDFLDGASTNVSGTKVGSQNDPLRGEIGLGGSYNWNDDKYSLYGEVSASSSLNNFGDSYSLGGKLGFRAKW